MENLEKYAIFDEILETFKMNKIKVNNSLFWESLSEYIQFSIISKDWAEIDFWWGRTLGSLIADYLNYKNSDWKYNYDYIDFYCTWFEKWTLNAIERVKQDKKNQVKAITESWIIWIRNFLYNCYYDYSDKKLNRMEAKNKKILATKNMYKKIIDEYFKSKWYEVKV
jgi:hypothetical protein